jgi:hypothetical protein
MPHSQQKHTEAYGTAWHTGGAKIAELQVYVTYAGSPATNVVPAFIGQWCFDTVDEDFYLATGLEAADWKQVTA